MIQRARALRRVPTLASWQIGPFILEERPQPKPNKINPDFKNDYLQFLEAL